MTELNKEDGQWSCDWTSQNKVEEIIKSASKQTHQPNETSKQANTKTNLLNLLSVIH